ncbi:uncharacterized protein LOC125835476 [Solanum verrucosum]|uniref:uncharacterized protein LOC125835476 n=1 Tax=Solanum verrucosum TaxID=315347 RepID=UPI0020D1F3F7|nr:uncharacterized protein LOC125835476 [Solanum verrucosum]
MAELQNTKVQHLIREGSDHAPLHVTCSTGQEQIYKLFRFLNFLTKHHSFQKIVEDVWKMEATGSPLTVVQTKMKRVKLALVQWSRTTFGNIFQQVATLEDLIRAKKVQLEINASEENRTTLKKSEADLKKYLHIEEEYWKQKAGMRWFKDGDRNTKFFHAFVNGRRRKMHIFVIKTRQRYTITTTQNIGKKAVNVFKEQFKETYVPTDFSMLEHIPKIISEEQNEEMGRLPAEKEIKEVVFALNGDSASGPDGFSGQFFQSCWDTVKWDIVNMVRAFFCGQELPRFITHTNLVFIPKKEVVDSFGDLRPISLRQSYSIKKMMKVLREYEQVSGQMINLDKSFVYLHENVPLGVCRKIKRITACVITDLHRIFVKFFWANTTGAKNKHWVSWDRMCYPRGEGGLGWRSLHDVSKALFAKLWWNFRTSTNTLWAFFMRNKYCKKHHPIIAQGYGTSHVWRRMTSIREEVEHEIWWQNKAGNSSFWFDNWTKQGALYHIEDTAKEEEVEVKEFEGWDMEKLLQNLSLEMTDHIMENISPPNILFGNDVAWWMANAQGRFTVKSAWQIMRNKHENRRDYELIWNKRLPFKINFFLWRVWKRRIATDDNLKKMRINSV